MPELPEVETIRRDLEKTILHKIIRRIEVRDPFVLRTPLTKFIKTIEKQSINAVSRRGKALLLELSNRHYLVVQVMMTGQLVADGKVDKHTRVIFEFMDQSCLLYNDQRRFGQLHAVSNLKDVKHLSLLGPEPFDHTFNAEYIFQYTRNSKRPIKSLLLDHTFVAGIGNIYACEILFRCKITPKRLSGAISRKGATLLHRQIIEVLKEAIEHRGSSMRNYRDGAGQKGTFKKRIKVYAREDAPCLVCQTPIKRIVQAGRSTFFCPRCQK
jgi:formamidopyrimidine-DNA glycosylase